jgi:hypothetical protein
MKSERDWERYERDYEGKRVEAEAKERRRRLREASELGSSPGWGLAHWLVGGVVLFGGLFVLHNASAEEAPKSKEKPDPKGAAKPAPTPSPGPAPASRPPATTTTARTSPFPVGTHVEAQDRDGQWYGAVINRTNLADPHAVRWDAGTPGAARNPKSGTSPASAVRASPGTGAAPSKPPSPPSPTDAAVKEALKGADTSALQAHLKTIAEVNPSALPASIEAIKRTVLEEQAKKKAAAENPLAALLGG